MAKELTKKSALVKLVPGENLDAYLQTIHSIPLLSAEREHELAVAYHDHGDVDAARELILAHLRFVAHIARSYTGYGLPQADLIQEGNVGLMKALKRFDPGKGVRFITFAVHWVKSEIHDYIIRNWRLIKIATTKAQRKLFFNLRRERKQLERMSNEEAGHIADSLGVPVKDVREMENRFNTGAEVAFDTPQPVPGSNEDEEHATSPAEYLESENSNPAEILEKEDWEQNSHKLLQRAMGRLDERSRDIIQKRWLNEEHRATLNELAQEYSVSMERIRQIEQRALDSLREEMGALIH